MEHNQKPTKLVSEFITLPATVNWWGLISNPDDNIFSPNIFISKPCYAVTLFLFHVV